MDRLNTFFSKTITSCWYGENKKLRYILQPCSGIYRAVIAARRALYRHHIFSSFKPPIPVIIVGNLSVGGTGKTPVVIALAQWLKTQGFRPGIVSRGYRGQGPFPMQVNIHSDPAQVGDEPVLLAKKANCPIVVDPNRINAVKMLLENYDCDIILSDDGLQHYALGRDIEIAVVDGERFNEACLPAGPLREPISRLNDVDFILVRGSHLLPSALNHKIYPFTLKQGLAYSLVDLEKKQPLKTFSSVHAVAGIGDPGRFFNALRATGLEVIEHAFPDHHQFSKADIDWNGTVLMTEKDAVKCQAFADERHWAVPVEVKLCP